MTLSHRIARRADVPALKELMTTAIRQLQRGFLAPDAIEASFDVMGLDTQLIDDGTYFVIEQDGMIAGCGGWSRRATLFGGDHSAGRSAALLDPAKDAARVRAMYTNPSFARRVCESAARIEGFTRVELAATMAGMPLYRACGYREIEAFEADTRAGIRIPLMRMGKAIAPLPVDGQTPK